MGDFILLVNCYLYGIIIIMLAVLLLLVYVRGTDKPYIYKPV